MDQLFFDKICVEYKRNYEKIFEQIYPAKNSTGFTERNLSVNFSKAYEKTASKENQTCITWYEFQFGNENNKHYDAVIINTTAKEILVVEAKRYKEIPRSINSIMGDIQRIISFPKELSNENSCRIPDYNQYKIYGVVLADIWTSETSSPKQKLLIKEQYANNTFIKTNQSIINYINNQMNDKEKSNLNHTEFMYNIQDFNDCVLLHDPLIINHYFLLSMLWALT